MTPDSNNTEVIYKGEGIGRIFGLALTSDDSTLYFASELKGLIKLDIASKQASFLLSEVQGSKIKALNAICIDEDREIIYLTDTSPIRMSFFVKELLIGHQAGRVISYDLKTGEAKVLLDKIAFANGIVF